MRDIHGFLNQFTEWAARHEDILAVVLVGSFARGTARADSDIDLVLICDDPQRYLKDEQWLTNFGTVTGVQDEDWGLVQSKRVFYEDVGEVEFGLTTAQWVATDPVDAGTRRVIADGARILTDRTGMMASLVKAIEGEHS
jgi:hypothetical protein